MAFHKDRIWLALSLVPTRQPGKARNVAPEAVKIKRSRAFIDTHLAKTLPADLLIVNPPRAGLDPETLAIVAEGGARRVIYVSCDPATLARDVASLSDRYEPGTPRCFDLFPQTAHVETVMVLSARGAS